MGTAERQKLPRWLPLSALLGQIGVADGRIAAPKRGSHQGAASGDLSEARHQPESPDRGRGGTADVTDHGETKAEAEESWREMLRDLDLNNDGVIQEQEWLDYQMKTLTLAPPAKAIAILKQAIQTFDTHMAQASSSK